MSRRNFAVSGPLRLSTRYEDIEKSIHVSGSQDDDQMGKLFEADEKQQGYIQTSLKKNNDSAEQMVCAHEFCNSSGRSHFNV
jgi:hypothetical protein